MPTSNYYTPIASPKFHITQPFFAVDAVNYPITHHHPGVDYGTQGDTNTPLFFVTDGEVIESGINKTMGNYFFFYCPGPDRTFVYFHLRDAAPRLGGYRGGAQCGIAGSTGLAQGIHLHLECMRGRQTSASRIKLLTSPENMLLASEDPDAFIKARLPI